MNHDPILHSVHGKELGTRPRVAFNIAQPIEGQRTRLRKVTTEYERVLHLSCEAGHPWMSGYILLTPHPYAAVTGEDGSFVIEQVPPGTYEIVMWHEGVHLVDVNRTLQLYRFEAPYAITRRIEVPPDGLLAVDFELRLRTPGATP